MGKSNAVLLALGTFLGVVAMVTGKLLLDCREMLCAFNTMGEY